jgi:hypothetical protein
MLVSPALSLLYCQPTAAQDVFVPVPLLTHLAIGQELSEHSAQMLAALRLDTLRSLDVRMDLCYACLLHGCTQLQALRLTFPNIKGVSALAQLTGLTHLDLYFDPWTHQALCTCPGRSWKVMESGSSSLHYASITYSSSAGNIDDVSCAPVMLLSASSLPPRLGITQSAESPSHANEQSCIHVCWRVQVAVSFRRLLKHRQYIVTPFCALCF